METETGKGRKTVAFEHYVRSGAKLLRCGYTTGTCAALAAAAATRLLLTGSAPKHVSLMTQKGLEVDVPIEQWGWDGTSAWCAVVKDAGDDADVTNGTAIVATVSHCAQAGVTIDGGKGVGRVTKPGLDQPVGNAAINRVPRQMIAQAVTAVCEELCHEGGMQVIISAPDGKALAQKTFNPQLGVVGGISILGTSGIVEPMSEQAIVATIAVEVHQAALSSHDLILTPGNYGQSFLREHGMETSGIPIVKSSNFIGESLDIAASEHMQRVLLVGHIGKLVKLAGGIMNTHSRWADCRTELFCAHAAVCGAEQATCQALLNAATTDACIEILDQCGLRRAVFARLLDAIQFHLNRRAAGAYRVGAVLFSNEYGLLGTTEVAEEIIGEWNKNAEFSTE